MYDLSECWTVCSVSANALSKEEVRECQDLSFEDGMMRYGIIDAKAKNSAEVLRIFDQEYLVGWAMIWKRATETQVHVYVHDDYRGQGIGKALMREVNAKNQNYRCLPHDRDSLGFYLKNALPGSLKADELRRTDMIELALDAVSRTPQAFELHAELELGAYARTNV